MPIICQKYTLIFNNYSDLFLIQVFYFAIAKIFFDKIKLFLESPIKYSKNDFISFKIFFYNLPYFSLDKYQKTRIFKVFSTYILSN